MKTLMLLQGAPCHCACTEGLGAQEGVMRGESRQRPMTGQRARGRIGLPLGMGRQLSDKRSSVATYGTGSRSICATSGQSANQAQAGLAGLRGHVADEGRDLGHGAAGIGVDVEGQLEHVHRLVHT